MGRRRPSIPLALFCLAVGGCAVPVRDAAEKANPLPVWGSVDCESPDRHARVVPERPPGAGGEGDGDGAFRRLTVLDGDDHYGERCELGSNDQGGPTAVYREGERWLTFLSLRLPPGFPLEADDFQVVMQMKQTQPAANGGGTPVLALEVRAGRWRLMQSKSRGPSSLTRQLWSAPARAGVWTDFVFDVAYSSDPRRGALTVRADLNADGDFADPDEISPRIRTYTLKIETVGGEGPLAPGDSIPSHLRVGPYHDPSIPCPPPIGCPLDVDEVAVVSASE